MSDPEGVTHRVEVTAESLFEAAALALHAFKKDGWTDFVANVLEIEVREPVVKHQVTATQVRRWLDSAPSDLRERNRREKLKAMVG